MALVLYIFNKLGEVVHYHEWERQKQPENLKDECKSMFGLLFTLKVFTQKLDPHGKGDCSFHAFKTNSYKLHYMESPTGLRFVLLTQPSMGDLRQALRHIYNNLYVEMVVKNPLNEGRGSGFVSEAFRNAVDRYGRTLH
mmetsp:Transcript_28284/g.92320  ORF Transcript_28284/g.92320 Transcript_28284/m.92320 type:complete len:139 (+) Transcript_28284:73-489(+)